MSNTASSLPDAWVERIWATMRANYGSSFDRQWEVPAGADPVAHVAQMKAFWGQELAGYQQSPSAIKHALSVLPEHPPNLIQFKALLRGAPQYNVPKLPPPTVEGERLAQHIQQSAQAAKVVGEGPKAWAEKLRDKERSGLKLTMAQRHMWRAALRERDDQEQS